jgi:hypothetical protein
MVQHRRTLDQRRACETFSIDWAGFSMPHKVTIGFYNDGRIGEVFINGGKSGEAVEAIARDGAVLLSLALQYGVPMQDIAHAITRDSRDQPQTIVGAIVDMLAKREENEAGHTTGNSEDGRATQGMAAGGAPSGELPGKDDRG